ERAGCNNGASFRMSFVVLLDIVEIVEVIHHQAMGLRDCAIGRVSEPVDSLEPRAVTKMETRNGIDWRTTFIAGTEIIPRCTAHQRLFQPAEDFGATPPI